MTVRCSNDVIYLEGACPVEDAEHILALLQERPERHVDLSQCSFAHSAVAQVLLAARPTLCGGEPQGFVQQWVLRAIPYQDGDMLVVARSFA